MSAPNQHSGLAATVQASLESISDCGDNRCVSCHDDAELALDSLRGLIEQLGTAQDALRHLVLMDDDSSDVSVIARTGLGESYPASEPNA